MMKNDEGSRQEAEVKTILMIDDSVVMLKHAWEILRQFTDRYRVIPVTSGEEGLRVLSNNKVDVDLIILEYKMQKMDGFTFLEEMRKRRIDIPVILTAQQMSREIMNETVPMGVVGFLNKPYPQTSMINMLHSILYESDTDNLR